MVRYIFLEWFGEFRVFLVDEIDKLVWGLVWVDGNIEN